MLLPEVSGRPPKHLGVQNVYFFYILRIIKSFIYPTNAQLNCSKMLKFTLIFTLKVLHF